MNELNTKYGNIIVEIEAVRTALSAGAIPTATLHIALPLSWRAEFKSISFPQTVIPFHIKNEPNEASLYGFRVIFADIEIPEIRIGIV